MAGMKITKGIAAAGWIAGVGDALRGAGKALGILMLDPRSEGYHGGASGMFRIRVGARVTTLECRAHGTPTGRCSRGRWEALDKGATPANAREWAKLANFWGWFAAEYAAGRHPYSWADDAGKSHNRCHTKAHANALTPTLAAGAAPGRGRIGRSVPTKMEAMGFAPTGGKALGYAERIDKRARRKARAHAAAEAVRWGR